MASPCCGKPVADIVEALDFGVRPLHFILKGGELGVTFIEPV